MANIPYSSGSYIGVPTAYDRNAGFEANDLAEYGNFTGSLQRPLSSFSGSTASYESPILEQSPGTSLGGFDFNNHDSTYYEHCQAKPNSTLAGTTASYTSYASDWTTSSIPRYGNTLGSRQMIVHSSNMQPSSITTTQAPQYQCLHPGCTQKPFRRSADLDRHHKHVHARSDTKEKYFCDYKRCSRSEQAALDHAAGGSPSSSANGIGAFHRKDHMRNHLRECHREDLLKRNGKHDDAWLDERIIRPGWWRCVKCLSRVSVKNYDYECPDCGQVLEPERANERNRRFAGSSSSGAY